MGVEDMDFPGVLKKQQVEFPGVKFKNVEFPALIKKKSCGIPGLLVLGVKISEGRNTICGVSRGEALFCLEFPRLK